ncbi:MAG: YceD family protein [Propioniciclava sp.]
MTRSIDPRSVLVFDIRDFGHQAGAMKEIVTEVPAPGEFGSDVIGVPTGSSIALNLQFEGVGDGVLATGTAGVLLRGECARCLQATDANAEVDLQELFLFPGTDPDDQEASRVEGECIDLEPVLRDAVVLDLPFIPLCRENCRGLCSTCGADLNADPAHGHDQVTDPRWSGLAGWTGGAQHD